MTNKNIFHSSCENQITKECEVHETVNRCAECSKKITFREEFDSAAPTSHFFCVKNIEKISIEKIRNLKCSCKEFHVSQKMNISSPQFGEAVVKIGRFYKYPKLRKTNLTAIPNSYSKKQKVEMEEGYESFILSVFDLCQTHNLTIAVESWPTCTNWKIKSEAVKFPIKDINADILPCQFNQTFATLRHLLATT